MRAQAGAVVKHEAVAIGCEYKGNIQCDGVIQRLLHPVAHGVVVVLRLDQGNRKVLVIEDIISPLGLASRDQLATDDNAAFSEKDFATDLERLIPPSLDDGGRDVLGTNIGLAQVFFAHNSFFSITLEWSSGVQQSRGG